ncbi:hypothetical protein GGR57DRAFT_499352 [Xylariaceae sp. FL1272]|nr:hypothetical protein GGR57DRAFT_499352 [Xylariaceae sp. FL1272]
MDRSDGSGIDLSTLGGGAVPPTYATSQQVDAGNASTPPSFTTTVNNHKDVAARSRWPLLAVLVYVGLALFSWAVTLVVTRRPLGASSYGASIKGDSDTIKHIYSHSEDVYEAARVVQAIIGILTNILTIVVCGRAVIIYMQRNNGLTRSEVFALSDERRLGSGGNLTIPSSWRWQLLYAVALVLIGSAIPPVQDLFLSTQAMKIPTYANEVAMVPDLITQFPADSYYSDYGPPDDTGLMTLLMRNRLASTTSTAMQPLLWQGKRPCDANPPEYDSSYDDICQSGPGSLSFANISALEDPFFSPVAPSVNTGMLRQFATRINSTARREIIEASAFPENCAGLPGSLYIDRQNSSIVSDSTRSWRLTVCMPSNQTASPWTNTTRRQDFTEELYLRIFVNTSLVSVYNRPGTYYSRITVDTTAGYFELPNFMNNGIAGPLLADGPEDCGSLCKDQLPYDSSGRWGWPPRSFENTDRIDRREWDSERSLSPREDWDDDKDAYISNQWNKGPLLLTTLALFGNGSFIDTRPVLSSYQRDLYYDQNSTSAPWYEAGRPRKNYCQDLAPFTFLLRDTDGYGSWETSLDPCVSVLDSTAESLQVGSIMDFLWQFVPSAEDGFGEAAERIQNAFSAAAFMAGEVWMSQPAASSRADWLRIYADLGSDADIRVPVISLAGEIVVSILLGLYILGIIPVALYCIKSA